MSDKTNNGWLLYVLVAGLSIAIGFGAVYAMVGVGNKPGADVSVAGGGAADAPDRGGLINKAVGEAAPVGEAPGVHRVADATGLLSSPDGKPLNRGAMTTFVFKKQPKLIEKQPKFNGPEGQEMTLADFKGRVVLLNLWATWCAPCRKEMPHLDQLEAELGSNQFEVVALSVDRGEPAKAKAFLSEIGVKSLKFYHDPSAKAGFALTAIGMPTTLLIDRAGREIGRLVGPAEWHAAEAKALIRAAIAAK